MTQGNIDLPPLYTPCQLQPISTVYGYIIKKNILFKYFSWLGGVFS